MTVTFPNETESYRAARNALLQAETELRQRVEDVAALRRKLPLGGKLAEAYRFRDPDGSDVAFEDLFGAHDTLAVYSLMYGPNAEAPCPMCSAFLDGMNGQASHIDSRLALAVVAQREPADLARLKQRMGWHALPLHSALGSNYQSDYLAQSEDGSQLPMLNIFQRTDGGIHHFWGSEMFFAQSPWHPRHVDALWPLWNMFDLTPAGRGDHFPSLRQI